MPSPNLHKYSEENEFLKLLPKASVDSALLDFIRRRRRSLQKGLPLFLYLSSPLRRKKNKESGGGDGLLEVTPHFKLNDSGFWEFERFVVRRRGI